VTETTANICAGIGADVETDTGVRTWTNKVEE